MSGHRLEKTGSISKIAFDEACLNLARCLGLKTSGLSIGTRRHGDDQYIEITRPLTTNFGPNDCIHHFTDAQDHNDDHVSSDIEGDDDDDFAVYHSHPSHAPPTVEYHILHSTIYGVPVLYFFLHNIPYLMARNIDTVYQKLVPKQLRSELRSVSVLGGISMTNHPTTDVPCFWVHPCNSNEAMRNLLAGIKENVSPMEYLVLWIGLVGNAVGLSLPKEITS